MQNLIQAMHAANYSPDLAASLWQPIHGMPGSTQAVAKPVPQLAKLAHPGAASADVGEQGAIAVSKGPSAFHTPAQSDRHLIQAISIKPKVGWLLQQGGDLNTCTEPLSEHGLQLLQRLLPLNNIRKT